MNCKKALENPLNPNPLSMCLVHGRNLSNKKSDLKDVLLKSLKNPTLEEVETMCNVQYIVYRGYDRLS